MHCFLLDRMAVTLWFLIDDIRPTLFISFLIKMLSNEINKKPRGAIRVLQFLC
jgi:hypothetical protein